MSVAAPPRPEDDSATAASWSRQEAARLLAAAAVLVVDDEPGMRNFLQRSLARLCALLEVAGSAEEAEALRLRYHFDLLVVDIRLPGLSGLDWVSQLRERGVRTRVIYMTAYADLGMAVAALRHGADDFIMKPFRMEPMLEALHASLIKRQPTPRQGLLQLQLEQLQGERGVVGDAPAFRQVLGLLQRVAPTRSTLLFSGETGTGKELMAQSGHALSKRRGAFVPINCGSIAPELFESELFGHVRGAFTGAVQGREGLFMAAQGGTVFLDEVGELPAAMQTKLLRVLEERRIRPVGAEREQALDVRLMAATNRDLSEEVKAGRFRADLFFRLNVMPIEVPPLRERREDITPLVEHFIDTLSQQMQLSAVELLHHDWQRLRSHHWPGNVRELRNVVERTLLVGNLPENWPQSSSIPGREAGTGYPLDWPIDTVERAHMEAVLEAVNNNKSAAARQLGVSRKTLERKQQLWYGKPDDLPERGD